MGSGYRGGFGRSIPAWAGETNRDTGYPSAAKVYPRVGGGNPAAVRSLKDYEGLSPRGRGKPGHFPAVGVSWRSIPAWAGETAAVSRLAEGTEVYPRVGGGN